ncbi:DUF664 domain-containing protein [Actinoplanes sp. NPDC051861]|uniref:mycothiol transferase n=1 Tax=Actinoplanes sp. NPDC051861 TaxID=3155170 RepID=UPI00342D1A5A
MDAEDILEDAFGRLPELVSTAVEGLSPDQLRWSPRKGANTVGWLVWHLTRVQDSHLTELIGGEQVYLSGEWAPRFGLKPDPDDTGYAHTADQVAAVAPESAQVLLDYYAAVHERTLTYLRGLTAADLDRVVDENWDPPVTLGVRLVSVYDDDAQHAGQAAYVRGLLS